MRRNDDMAREIDRLRGINHDLKKMLRKLLKKELLLDRRSCIDEATQTGESDFQDAALSSGKLFSLYSPRQSKTGERTGIIYSTPSRSTPFARKSGEFWSQPKEIIDSVIRSPPTTGYFPGNDSNDVWLPRQIFPDVEGFRDTPAPYSRVREFNQAAQRAAESENNQRQDMSVPVFQSENTTHEESYEMEPHLILAAEDLLATSSKKIKRRVSKIVATSNRASIQQRNIQAWNPQTSIPLNEPAREQVTPAETKGEDGADELQFMMSPEAGGSARRPRRSVSKPLSYAETPLNVKVRKGFQFFKFA
jgi:hypothetical protein